jgi:hypothetical protein
LNSKPYINLFILDIYKFIYIGLCINLFIDNEDLLIRIYLIRIWFLAKAVGFDRLLRLQELLRSSLGSQSVNGLRPLFNHSPIGKISSIKEIGTIYHPYKREGASLLWFGEVMA